MDTTQGSLNDINKLFKTQFWMAVNVDTDHLLAATNDEDIRKGNISRS